MATSSLNDWRLASKPPTNDFRQQPEQKPHGMENILISGFISQMKPLINWKELTVLFSFLKCFWTQKGAHIELQHKHVIFDPNKWMLLWTVAMQNLSSSSHGICSGCTILPHPFLGDPLFPIHFMHAVSPPNCTKGKKTLFSLLNFSSISLQYIIF